MQKTISFNLNESVRVRLTDHGKRLYRQDWERKFKPYVAQGLQVTYHPPKEDAEGWSEWQLWHLMQEFGPHLHLGCNPPFDLTIQFSVLEPS